VLGRNRICTNNPIKKDMKTLIFPLIAILFAGPLCAAVITFDTPQSISHTSNGSFLDNSHPLVLAGNLAGSNTSSANYTVNGITFVSKTDGIFTGNGVTATISGTGAALSTNTAPANTWTNAALQEIFRGLGTSDAGNPGTVSMSFELSGLTIVQEYRLQSMMQQASQTTGRSTIWQNGSIATPSDNQSGHVVPSATTAGFISMTWTADATTQNFILLFDYDWGNPDTGQGRSAISAFAVMRPRMAPSVCGLSFPSRMT
jgi:hypothetical protein